MDSERFDGLVRSVGQARSRRQTLRGLAGAGALVALLAATSGEDATASERPHERLQGRTPKRNGKQRNQRQNNNDNQNNNKNQNNANTPNGGGGLGAVEPSPDCEEQCRQQMEQCRIRCTNPTCRAACDSLEDQMDQCVERCEFG